MLRQLTGVSIEAIYEHGQLRPVQPLTLPEGARVLITVEPPFVEPTAEEWDHERAMRTLREIWAMADPAAKPERTSIDHDAVLYGDRAP